MVQTRPALITGYSLIGVGAAAVVGSGLSVLMTSQIKGADTTPGIILIGIGLGAVIAGVATATVGALDRTAPVPECEAAPAPP